ncbi:hypothetical protein [Marisediminicola sp. LYQ85]|uniref:hypothetical protein n=1 Tax=Marisediminicola sp. LYQ85 TaxID=3391062 RepID=UPI003982D71F
MAIAEHKIEAAVYLPGYTVPAYDKVIPARTIFSTSFEEGQPVSGFSPYANASDISGYFTRPRTGRRVMAFRRDDADGPSSEIRKVQTGFTPGLRYRVVIWARVNREDYRINIALGVVGVASAEPILNSNRTEWQLLEVVFTATSTSHTIRLAYNPTDGDEFTGNGAIFDDFSVTQLEYNEPQPARDIPASGVPMVLKPETATVSLDESRSPFAVATLECADVDLLALEAIDPRTPSRMELTLIRDYMQRNTAADFDAYMIERYGPNPTIENWNTEFDGQSIEHFNAQFSNPFNPLTHVPPIYSYAGGAGVAKSDGWNGTQLSDSYNDGEWYLTAMLASRIFTGLTVGQTYRVTGVVTPRLGAPIEVYVQSSLIRSARFAISGNETQTVELLFRAPATSWGVQLYSTQKNPDGTSSGLGVWKSVQVVPVPPEEPVQNLSLNLGIRERTIDYASGTVTFTLSSDEAILQDTLRISNEPMAPAENTVIACIDMALTQIGAMFTRAGTVTDSPVDPEAALWQPGQDLDEYLRPILEAAGLRLYCDENRIWTLIMAHGYTRSTTALSDQVDVEQLGLGINRDDSTWFDAAVVKYQWVDANELNQTAYDTYAAPGSTKGRLFEYETPYPGPGAARRLVERAMERGQRFESTAVSDYAAYPGSNLTIAQVDRPTSEAYVGSVTWEFPDHTMRISTRGIQET